MRGFIGVLFLLYVAAAAASLSLGKCGFGSVEPEAPEVEYCAVGVALPE